MTEHEITGVELLMSEPEIVAWLELSELPEADDESSGDAVTRPWVNA